MSPPPTKPALGFAMSARSATNVGIIPILGILAAFAPVSTDMYLPAFRQMAEHFAVPEGRIEATLSLFFLGLAVGQGIYGPLSDRLGRRWPLLGGIALFVSATIMCLLVEDVRWFTVARFLQAVGGAAGMIIGRAIITDLFDAREGARALSLLLAVMMLAPILSPIVGGFIVTHAGWQAIFLFMLAFGLLCAFLVWFFIPDTLAPERRRLHGPVEIARTWSGLLTDRRFVVPAVVGGLAQACMFSFITGSPFVFMRIHGATPQAYGGLFALIACALIICSQLNRIALRHRHPEFLLARALPVNVVAGLLLVLSVSTGSLALLLIPLWCAIGTLGFIAADAAAVAMAASRANPGSGSSLVGVLQFGFAFAVSSLVAAMQNGTAYPMTVAISVSGLLAGVTWWIGARSSSGNR